MKCVERCYEGAATRREVEHEDMNDESAQRIYQAHLDDMGTAIAARDFVAYQTFFRFPHRFETMTEGVYIETPEDLRDFFDTLCAQLDQHEMPNMDRICKAASFSNARTINGYHQTRLVRHDAIVADSFAALCKLERHGDRWLLSHSQFAEGQAAMPTTVLARYLRRNPQARIP